MIRWLAAFLTLAICASCGEASPRPNPIDAIDVGVDIQAEANEILRGLVGAGYVLDLRLDAERFVALGLHKGTGITAVRMITARGVAFATDGNDDIVDRHPRVLLVRPPGEDARVRSATEMVFSVRDEELERTCLHIVAVGSDNIATEVPVRVSPWTPGACIEQLRDIDGDQTLETLVVYRAREFARTDAPTLVLPLARDPGTGGLSESSRAFPAYYASEVERRLLELETERMRLDVDHAYKIGFELGLLALLRGEGSAVAIARLETALRGLVLTESQAHSVAEVRAYFQRGMTVSPTSATHGADGR